MLQEQAAARRRANRRGLTGAVLLAATLIAGGPALAHDALISCFDNGNQTITCEAGYSDGSGATGQIIRVRQANKKLILEDKFNKESSFTFKKPDVDFIVEFFGDASHQAMFDGADLNK